MKLSDAVGKRVENLLAERNMTQYQLYKNGGIPRSTISVTVDGNIITSRGLGTALDFALTLIEELIDKETADKLAAAVVYM